MCHLLKKYINVPYWTIIEGLEQMLPRVPLGHWESNKMSVEA